LEQILYSTTFHNSTDFVLRIRIVANPDAMGGPLGKVGEQEAASSRQGGHYGRIGRRGKEISPRSIGKHREEPARLADLADHHSV
jgi:hypothetical protein